ncbi:MAG: LysM peptidoglycan-binding domain-containing protein [Flavobacteriaceae bacterium]|nr:LysM peptidoglycan-binding domain-containing protein [Flavobacteriaceae bacterium]
MFKKVIFVFALLICGISFSQDKTPSKKAKKKLPTKTIQVVDSISVPKLDEELPRTVVATQLRDSVIYELEDIKRARKIDSLWLSHLYNNDLFEEIYGSVSDLDYEPVEYEELPTEVLKKRLKELDARTPFHVEYNPSLESVIKGYLKNRRKTMARLMALSDYYFPMFEEEMARQDLPMEMKYLAVIESALDPKATSRVGAKGLWQFMFQTGKMFGLEVNSYVDERTDPLMATEAAAKYLKSLHKSLGDWDLALAAYNSGPGNVSKAIRRSGGRTNYWNIREFLPRETAGYVPAFLATMYIFEYAEEHGFKSHGPKFPYIATDTLHIKKMITLEQVAKVTNLDIAEVEFLNPSYKLGIIPVIKDENYVLRLPVDAIGKFVNNEEAIYELAETEFNDREKPLPQLFEQNDKIRYRVKSGDYLGRIADMHGVSVTQIKRWNGLKSNTLKVGQRLTIYPKGANLGAQGENTAMAKTENPKTYTVKSGDTLWSISKKFPNVSVEDLKKWNDISGNNLKAGTKIKVSKG